jgi:anti-sigma B factor antagonist
VSFTRPDAFAGALPGRAGPLGIRLSFASPDCLLAEIVGELDLNTAPTLQSRLSRAVRTEHLTELVVDLTRVEFLAVAGITALLNLREQARRRGVALRLVATHRAVLRPLSVLGLLDVFDVRDTLGS